MNYAYYQALAQGRLNEYLLEWEEEHSETEEAEKPDVDRVAVPGESGSESESAPGNQTRAGGCGSFLKSPDAVTRCAEVEMCHGDAGVNHLKTRVRLHKEADSGAFGRGYHAPRLTVGGAWCESHEREGPSQRSVGRVWALSLIHISEPTRPY